MEEKEFEEGLTENDKYLIREYLKHGTNDYLMTELGNKSFVVPYRYTVGSHTPKTSIKRFMNNLLDFELAEEGKYRRERQPVFTLDYEGRSYVVPYKMTENISAEELARRYEEKAWRKYNTVIKNARILERAGYETDMLDFSSVAAQKYSYRAKQLEMQRAKAIIKDKETIASNMAKGKDVKQPKPKIKDVVQSMLPKKYRTAAVVAAIVGAGAGISFMNNQEQKQETPIEQSQNIPEDTKTIVLSFPEKEHPDTFGNVDNICKQWYPEITAMLVAVEGFANEAFLDGGGTPTIASGTTFYIDDDGKETKVKLGDTVTPEEGIKYKWRFIEKEMLPLFGDNFGRKCTEKEALAGIGAGFCWGPDALEDSKFFEALKGKENLTQQLRKLSGFRKQRGLLKRSYVLACLRSGKWTPRDLLDLPVYEIKDKGYIHCSIYTLDLHDIMPCRKDKKGNYLKDKKGNDVPKVNSDTFCQSFYMNKAEEIRQKLIDDAKKSGLPYKTVRELMPQEMLCLLEPEKYKTDDVKQLHFGAPDNIQAYSHQNSKTFVVMSEMFQKKSR